MTLGDVGKQACEHRREHPRQSVYHSSALTYLHYAEPQREHSCESKRYLERRFRRLECRIHYCGKNLGVAHEYQAHHCYDEGYCEKSYPDVVENHVVKNVCDVSRCWFVVMFRRGEPLTCGRQCVHAPFAVCRRICSSCAIICTHKYICACRMQIY